MSLLMLVLDTDKALGGRQRGPAGFQPCRPAPWPRSAYWADWDSKHSLSTHLAPGVCSEAQRSRGLKSEPRAHALSSSRPWERASVAAQGFLQNTPTSPTPRSHLSKC